MSNEYTPCAFPVLERGGQGLELTDAGMTLRDYFAAQAMQVLLSKDPEHHPAMPVVHGVAEDSYVIADAMLAMRSTKAAMTAEPENPHRALLLQIHTELSHTASADADPANWEGYTLHRIEQLLWPENTGGNHETG